MIQPERIHRLNDLPPRPGRFVLYWMQASQRTRCNHALEYAIGEANRSGLPLLVFFELVSDYPDANRRHYRFMLHGLRDVETGLKLRGIPFVTGSDSITGAVRFKELATGASQIVTDLGYLRYQRQWRETRAARCPCRITAVESDVVVPVQTAYHKDAWSAAVLRRRITPLLPRFLTSLPPTSIDQRDWNPGLTGLPLDDPEALMDRLGIDDLKPKINLRGGEKEAQRLLKSFALHQSENYDIDRSHPDRDGTSGLSPYLHFGQISPIEIALEVPDNPPFLEQLIVRRELASNFAFNNPDYDRYEGLPDWCRETLAQHAGDPRPWLYEPEALERGQTHDRWWNAAQLQMVHTGFMHNTMRMYWGKKILEWSPDPQTAYQTALRLNNRYQLDGRDPNGYAGVAWCFGKHDRPWQQRDVFGKIRWMNAKGLERKYEMERYASEIYKGSGIAPES